MDLAAKVWTDARQPDEIVDRAPLRLAGDEDRSAGRVLDLKRFAQP